MTVQVKARLEQLDDLEEGSLQEQADMTQAEFIKKIEDYNQVCACVSCASPTGAQGRVGGRGPREVAQNCNSGLLQ